MHSRFGSDLASQVRWIINHKRQCIHSLNTRSEVDQRRLLSQGAPETELGADYSSKGWKRLFRIRRFQVIENRTNRCYLDFHGTSLTPSPYNPARGSSHDTASVSSVRRPRHPASRHLRNRLSSHRGHRCPIPAPAQWHNRFRKLCVPLPSVQSGTDDEVGICKGAGPLHRPRDLNPKLDPALHERTEKPQMREPPRLSFGAF